MIYSKRMSINDIIDMLTEQFAVGIKKPGIHDPALWALRRTLSEAELRSIKFAENSDRGDTKL